MKNNKSAWYWIPSLYFAEGLPYVAVMTLSVIMYKRLDISNTDIALFTSWLYFPWVIKPLWSPFVDLVKTKRWWICAMQLLVGAGMAGVAFMLPCSSFFQMTLFFFWLMAFSSATHDIAADGFYMLGLTQEKQAFFIGIRNTFYRIAMIAGQGLLVMLAGFLEQRTGHITAAWYSVFLVLSGLFIGLALWHKYVLPRPQADQPRHGVDTRTIWQNFLKTFLSFFQKKGVGLAVCFMLTYRLGESQLVKLASPFLLDSPDAGGLGLSTGQCLRSHRAIRIRLWIYGLYHVPDAICRRGIQDFPLCHLHGVHGLRHDAAGHGFRMGAGAYRLPAFLCLGDALLRATVHHPPVHPAQP